MTEQEAKTKWCPYMASKPTSYKMPNGDTLTMSNMCIASDCMMWREKLVLSGKDGQTLKGYCGLAGNP